MSAFLCGPEHIGALVDWYCHRPGSSHHVGDEEAAILLANANLDSVAYRYDDLETRDKVAAGFGGFEDATEYVAACVQASRFRGRAPFPPVGILYMLACFEYQSCETPEWYDTPIHKNPARVLFERIKGAAIRALDGYDGAPWEYRGQIPPPIPAIAREHAMYTEPHIVR